MPGILKSSLISVAATIVSLAAGFTCNIIAGRLLGPAGSGTVAFAIWIATSASAVADLGLPQTLLRNTGAASGSGEAWKGLVHAAFRSFARSVGIVGTVILTYALWLGRLDMEHGLVWLVTGALFIAYAFSTFSTAVARGRGRFGETATNTVIGGMFQIPLVFLGAWLWGPAGALIGHVARYLPQAARTRPYVRSPIRPLSRDMRAYGRNMWLSDLIEIMVLSRIEFLFLGLFFSTAQIGYFAAGLTLAGLIEQVTLQISPALVVGFAEAHARDDRETLALAYHRVVKMVGLIILPVSLGGAAIIPALLPFAFGPLFEPAVPAAVILMASVAPAALCVIPWGLIGAAGYSGQILRVQVASGVITILLLLAIVPWGGLEGAAWSRAGVGVGTLALLLWIARQRVGLTLPWAAIARVALAAAACAATAGCAVHALPPLPGLALGVTGGALVYLLALRLLGVVGSEETELLLEALEDRLPRPARPLFAGVLGFIAPR